MSYLLDTDVCIEIIRGKSVASAEKARTISQKELFICSIVKFELWFGMLKCERPADERKRLSIFWAGIESLPFTDGCAEVAAAVRNNLECRGLKIGAYDTLIAAVALHFGVTLVTRNLQEFRRVEGRSVEDWEA